MSTHIMMDSHERPIQVDEDGALEIRRLRTENERLRRVEKEKEEVVKLLKISNRKLGEVEKENEQLRKDAERWLQGPGNLGRSEEE